MMEVSYTPQFSVFHTMRYENDEENDVVKAIINESEIIEHDLSNYNGGYDEHGEPMGEYLGFPVHGYPERIDGVLYITLIDWYN